MFWNLTRKRFVLMALLSTLLSVVVVIGPVSASNQRSLEESKNKLILANKILDMKGLARPLGHISVRVPGRDDAFLITRNVSPGMAVNDDIVVCDMQGKVVEGKYDGPSQRS